VQFQIGTVNKVSLIGEREFLSKECFRARAVALEDNTSVLIIQAKDFSKRNLYFS